MRLAKDAAGNNDPIVLMDGGLDWYGDPTVGYARSLVDGQTTNGRFGGCWNHIFDNAWSIIILSPTIFELGPIAHCTADPLIDGKAAVGGQVDFDGGGSSHLDPEGVIDTYEWDFKDGATASGVLVTHSWENIGDYDVTLTVTDTNGLKDSTTCPVEIVEEGFIPPNAEAGGPYTFCIGAPMILDGSASYDLDGAIISWEWDWTPPIDFSPADAAGVTADATSYFEGLGEGTYDLGLRVTDDSASGNANSEFTTATVLPATHPSCNQPPAADPNGPYQGDEGSGVPLDGTGSTDPDGDPLTYTWSVDGGGVCTAYDTATTSCTWPDNGLFNVCLTVDDGQYADQDCTTATIANVDPDVGPITAPTDPVPISDPVCASADFTDPGTADTHVAEWGWGDSTTSAGTVTETDGSGTVGAGDTDCHTYGLPGVYTLELTVTDDDGGLGSAIYQYVVVYDPDDGFVTGGGWIDSPPGAYVADDTLAGKATFGFVSKYKRGQSTPSGSTEFQFHAGDLNFHSNTYDWLVIAHAKAMFKGVGTINGAGNFGFMIMAIDAKLTPSTDVDLFRIKIWDKDNGDAVVYDNEIGFEIDDDPATAIGGGSIVIHKR